MRDSSPSDRARLDLALTAAGVRKDEAVQVEELGGGTFNRVWRVRRADGTELVAKLAPGPEVPVLRYEHGLLATESDFYRLVAERADVPVPRVLTPRAAGDVPPDHLVMTCCPGRNWYEVGERLTDAQRRALREELGRYVAALHGVTGEAFGCPAEPLGPMSDSWRTAFLGMVDAVLADADRFGVRLPEPSARIRQLFAERSAVLDEVTSPRLVHFDLWDGNVLVDGLDGFDGFDGEHPRIGALVDAERAFWGDPLADFVSLALFGDIEQDDAFLAGYRSAGGTVTFDEPARRRLELYRSYLYLIMWVEAVPRGYDEPRREWLRGQVLRPLADTFTSWSGDRGEVSA